ncbi:MAG: SDR family NAD(P)-dependent oxidoreductase [Desulfovibrio sp.]|nr:SDR family NAD(P)-dependent oxidoreductase [Desulfovibrio sp.]
MKSCITMPIAVIGVGCRLPGGVTDLPSLWSVLAAGRDCIVPVPSSRWDGARFYHPERTHPGTSVTIKAGFLDNIYDFDADFFGISPKEAESMDPQQRILLELTWEAMEDAGIKPSSLSGSDTAVFVGAASPDGGTCHADDICATSPYSMTGTNLSIIANRLSYIYNFHGPSFTLDTACSSSLYALHQACQILAIGGASMAFACGVNVLLAPYPFVGFSQAYMLSPEGKCKVFDAHGNGYVRAEGGGALLLEPLDLARKNKHPVHCVIKAIACNSDGRTQGIALPSSEAQEELLVGLYEAAACDPDSLSYLEAHGTGTVVGDPIETRAIGHALGMKRSKPLPIGSIKSNVGHLETASAMAGIAKAIVMLKERAIPKQLHITTLNPDIDFERLNLHVPLTMEPLVAHGPLRIGVNSFGFGGANGHVLLEEAPTQPSSSEEVSPNQPDLPLFLSARSEKSLTQMAGLYAKTLEENPESYAALAETLALHRETMPIRLVAQGNARDVALSLRSYAETGEPDTTLFFGQALSRGKEQGKTAFVFAGNGCHWLGMGRDLLANPVFKAKAEEVALLFREFSTTDFLDLLQNGTDEDLERTENTQPLIFLIQICICALLEAQGIRPDYVYGHSFGEVAAVWAAGLLSLRDAVKVVYYRSVCQGKTKGCGKMAAAKLSVEEFFELAKSVGFGEVELAGINAPSSLTLCGSERGLRAIGNILAKRRVFFRMLPLDYAFHSSAMETIHDELLTSLAGIHAQTPHCTFLSTVGQKESLLPLTVPDDPNFFDAGYWWQNIRRPVMFYAATAKALKEGVRYFLEISPHAILQQYIRSAMKTEGVQAWVGATMQRKADNVHLLNNVWRVAWTHGWPFALSQSITPSHNRPVRSFPSYPWNRVPLRTKETPESYGFLQRKAQHPLLGWQIKNETSFENVLDLALYPWLSGHRVGESVFFPAACYLEMSLACARTVFGSNNPIEISNTAILRPVILDTSHSVVLRTAYEKADGEIRIYGRPYMQDSPWVLYSRGRTFQGEIVAPEPFDFVTHPSDFGSLVSKETFYQTTRMANMQYAEAFQSVEQVWLHGDVALAKFCEPAYSVLAEQAEQSMFIPPALLDGGLQLLFLLLADELPSHPFPRLPFWFDRCVFYRAGRPRFATIHLIRHSERTVVCDVHYLDAQGETLLALFGGRAKSAERLGVPKDAVCYTTDFVQIAPLTPSTVPHWKNTQEKPSTHPLSDEYTSLLHAASEAIIAEHLALQSKTSVPPQLSSMMQQTRKTEDLPPFALLWQTLLRDWPSENATNLLLLAAHAKLVAKEPLSLDQLYIQYFEDCGARSLPFLEAYLPDKDPSENGPLTVILTGAGRSGLVPFIKKRLFAHSLWITDTTREAIERIQNDCEPWTPSADRIHYAEWAIDTTTAPCSHASMLLACNILHDCDNLLAALQHCKESLLPGGRLIILETAPSLPANLVFGLKPSFWQLSQTDDTPVSRFLPPSAWQKALEDLGFTTLACPSNGSSFLLVAQKNADPANCSQSACEPKESNKAGSPNTVLVLGNDAPSASFATKLSEEGLVCSCVNETATLFSSDKKTGEETWQALFQQKPDALLLPLFADDLAVTAAIDATWKIVRLAQAWQKAGKPSVRVYLVTFGAYALPSDPIASPALASAIGAMRVIANEMPSLHCIAIDLPCEPSQKSILALCDLVQGQPTESEYVIRESGRYCVRSHEVMPSDATENGSIMRLAIDEPGHLERLTWHKKSLPDPDCDEVRIAVRATGLNFRDVMWAMNLLPEEALENGFSGAGLGIECAGIVEKVGRSVTNVTVGDRVVAFGSHCFSSHILTKATACAKIPAAWDFSEAASVPVTFFTVYYALSYLARMEEGERILIHGGAGGIGLTAIQIAFSLGLEVYATAGSPLKRHLLKTLGVEHVYDSRSLAFRDLLLRDTEGEGVDCVLNSLAGEAMSASLNVLKPFGRFLELGKSDFFADSALRLRPFRNNISYFGIDVDQLMKERPQLGQRLFTEMMQHFTEGNWTPLPCTVFAADEVEQAFRFMQQSHHVGKIIVTPPDVHSKTHSKEPTVFPIVDNATYLVTGGLGGFGLESARFLATHGAGALLLLSRSGETESNKTMIDELRAIRVNGKPCQIKALACDVSNESLLRTTLETALQDLPPLKGVLHAAAVLDDCLVENLTKEKLARVLQPKVSGAFALHAVTKDMPLDFFILYSSVTTLMGNPGQVNYVAANMAMESLASMRRAQGLPGLAVGWGAIGDAGMLTRDTKTLESLTHLTGIHPLSTKRAMEILASLFAKSPATTYVFSADWQKLRNLPIAKHARLSPLIPQGAGTSTNGQSLLERIAGKNDDEVHDLVLNEVIACVARILRTSPNTVRPSMPLQEMGIDSLMGVELSLALEELMNGHPLAGSINATISAEDLTRRIIKTVQLGEERSDKTIMTDLMESHGISSSQKNVAVVEEAVKDVRVK